jgi:hypothetical protein
MATNKQIDFLMSLGKKAIDIENLSTQEASKLIDKLLKQQNRDIKRSGLYEGKYRDFHHAKSHCGKRSSRHVRHVK